MPTTHRARRAAAHPWAAGHPSEAARTTEPMPRSIHPSCKQCIAARDDAAPAHDASCPERSAAAGNSAEVAQSRPPSDTAAHISPARKKRDEAATVENPVEMRA